MSMTDNEVVEGAERMARELLRSNAFGYETSEPSIRKSRNPRAVSAWRIVEKMLDAYNGTDLQSAVDSVDEDEDSPPAPELPVTLGRNHLEMLRTAQVGTCGCANLSADYRQHHQKCGFRLLSEVALMVAAQQGETTTEVAARPGVLHA
jgi:hypothetical protein